MTAAWPNDSGFPQYFLVGVKQTNSDSVVAKQMDAGTAKRRLREDGGYERFEGSIAITRAQYKDIFRPFFYTTCRRIGPFSWVHPFTSEAVDCVFTEKGYTATTKDDSTDLLDVSFEIEVALT